MTETVIEIIGAVVTTAVLVITSTFVIGYLLGVFFVS